MSQYPSGSAPPYQPNPHIPSNPSDQKSQLASETIRMVNPTPAENHNDTSLATAEANYWKARQAGGGEQQAGIGYADPYEYLDDSGPSRQRQGHQPNEGHSPTAYPYNHAAGANSDPTIGPWDSASQRSNSLRAQNASALGYGRPAENGVGAGVGGAGVLSGIAEERGGQGSAYGGAGGGSGYGGPAYANPYAYNSGPGAKDDPYAQAEEYEMRGLVSNAAGMGQHDPYGYSEPPGARPGYGGAGGPSGDRSSKYGFNNVDDPYSWPPLDNVNANSHLQRESPLMAILLFPTGLDRLMALFGVHKGRMPVQQQVERKKHGVPGQRFPVATWALTAGE